MPNSFHWEEIQQEKPMQEYASMLHRMRVEGGYIYKHTTMYAGGLFGSKFSTSVVFVPDERRSN